MSHLSEFTGYCLRGPVFSLLRRTPYIQCVIICIVLLAGHKRKVFVIEVNPEVLQDCISTCILIIRE